MALKFTPSEEKKPEVIEAEATVTDTVTAEADKPLNLKITEPQSYSIVDTSNKLKQELASSDEIDKLVSTIDANDPNSIITFGNSVAEEISKASDQVLLLTKKRITKPLQFSIELKKIKKASEKVLRLTKKIVKRPNPKRLLSYKEPRVSSPLTVLVEGVTHVMLPNLTLPQMVS